MTCVDIWSTANIYEIELNCSTLTLLEYHKLEMKFGLLF